MIAQIDARIAQVMQRRAAKDAQFEAEWRERQRSSWWRRAPVADDAKPDSADDLYWGVYPSKAGWGTLERLEIMRAALETNNTGAVFFEEKEIRALTGVN
jgi:hypothetical protein